MKLEKLKENLAMLTISDLEELGLSLTDFEDDEIVQLYTTTDEYSQEKNEVTWVASVNTENHNLVTITNGLLYDEETAEELSRPAEISRIFVDENKAEMFIDALFHAYPSLVHDVIQDDSTSASAPIEKPIDTASKKQTIDQTIGALKKEILRLEKLKETKDFDGDKAIDVYKKIKLFSSRFKESKAEPEIVRRKNTMLFISGFEKDKVIKLVEINIGDVVREEIDELPSTKITKTILIDRHLARPLHNALNKIFKK